MEYKCNIILLTQLMSIKGAKISDGLCNKCCTKDCTNPIETKVVSILGVNKKGRFYIRGNEPSIVINCDGFMEEDISGEESDR